MSTDYKIGIVVGLLVLIVGVTYFLVSGGDESAPQTPPSQGESEPHETIISGDTDFGGVEPGDDLGVPQPPEKQPPDTTGQFAVKEGESDIAPVKLSGAPREGDAMSVGWNLNENADVEVDLAEGGAPVAVSPGGVEIAIAEAADAGEGFNLNADAASALKEADPVITTVKKPQPVDLGGKDTYTVQRGDLGFWYIAEKVYGAGNGKFWTRIRDANPRADTNNLRPGQVLRIPPLPRVVTASREPPARPESYSKTITSTTGQKIYVVGKSEPAGLWGIAAKPEVYGKGYHWRYIQQANPVAASDPTRLKPGTQLIIPPLPKRTPTTVSVMRDLSKPPAVDHGRTIVQGGRKYYFVQAGDAGYWSVAKKMYGEGKYNYLIDRANPGVDSNSLRPGMKLYIPPKPVKTPGGERRTRTPAPVRSGSSVPDFGP